MRVRSRLVIVCGACALTMAATACSPKPPTPIVTSTSPLFGGLGSDNALNQGSTLANGCPRSEPYAVPVLSGWDGDYTVCSNASPTGGVPFEYVSVFTNTSNGVLRVAPAEGDPALRADIPQTDNLVTLAGYQTVEAASNAQSAVLVPPKASVTATAFTTFGVYISFDVQSTGESYLAQSLASYALDKLPGYKAQSFISDIQECATSSSSLWGSINSSSSTAWSDLLGNAVDTYVPCKSTLNTLFSAADEGSSVEAETNELASLDTVKEIGTSWSEKILSFLTHNAPVLEDFR